MPATARCSLPFALPGWLPYPGRNEKRAALALLDDLVRAHIGRRRAAPDLGDDLLGMLLAASDEEGEGEERGAMLGDDGVRDQLMTTFLAGHETTAAALTRAGWALAAHPDVAARATEEVDRVLGNRVPGYQDVAELPCLGSVVKEVMRLYSPSPGVLARRATRDVRIGDWLVPQGSGLDPVGAAASRRALVYATGALRPRPLSWRGGERHSARRLPALRYRPARLHRQQLRHGRDDAGAGHAAAALHPAPGAGPGCPGAAHGRDDAAGRRAAPAAGTARVERAAGSGASSRCRSGRRGPVLSTPPS
ncbi:cytochrome P450 [Massilia sp. Dwa41.01b]|nr:cytochrome P450 [Massilia sp. Dwa41.01b]QNA89720.1 cytochrome P450 [Massilia sp. Dwa41.01b]